MKNTRPYTETDSPREWARKKILDLEDAVAALKTRLDEQGAIIEALKAPRPSRFLERPLTGIDWLATVEQERRLAAAAQRSGWQGLRGRIGRWVTEDGGPLREGGTLIPDPDEPSF